MKRHLFILERGSRLKVHGGRLSVKIPDQNEREIPLSKIKTISITGSGAGLSTNLATACSVRGIRIFIMDFRNVSVLSVSSIAEHAAYKIRKTQFYFQDSIQSRDLAAAFVYGKIRNQRSVIKYFSKNQYLGLEKKENMEKTAKILDQLSIAVKKRKWKSEGNDWRNILLGYEGEAASKYWHGLNQNGFFSHGFEFREKRNAHHIVNQALNYGYAVMTAYIWNAVLNAGLEPYAGFLHTGRPGKPSLILDLMEEYRAWTVDRVIIKMRKQLEKEHFLQSSEKKKIVQSVNQIFQSKLYYQKKRLRLESIVQRQVYRLAGLFFEDKKYKPYLFKW